MCVYALLYFRGRWRQVSARPMRSLILSSRRASCDAAEGPCAVSPLHYGTLFLSISLTCSLYLSLFPLSLFLLMAIFLSLACSLPRAHLSLPPSLPPSISISISIFFSLAPPSRSLARSLSLPVSPCLPALFLSLLRARTQRHMHTQTTHDMHTQTYKNTGSDTIGDTQLQRDAGGGSSIQKRCSEMFREACVTPWI